MLSKHIQASCIDDAAGVRAMSCDCLASIPKPVYEQLPVSFLSLFLSLFLSYFASFKYQLTCFFYVAHVSNAGRDIIVISSI